MAIKKRKQEILEREIYIRISEDLNDLQAQQRIREEIKEVIEEEIELAKEYKKINRPMDTSIGITLGLNNHEAFIEYRRRASERLVDCDYRRECTAPVKSAHLCYTKQYKICGYYKKPENPPKRGNIGITFSSSQD